MDNRPQNEIPPGQEIADFRLWLINEQGYTPGQAGQALGQTAGKNRGEIGNYLSKWQRENT